MSRPWGHGLRRPRYRARERVSTNCQLMSLVLLQTVADAWTPVATQVAGQPLQAAQLLDLRKLARMLYGGGK